MSRIGKKPITVPAGVEVKIDGHTVTVKGPKGTLTRTLNEEIGIQMEGNEILVTRPNDDIKNRSLHGLNRTLIHNMVVGVTEGFEKKLEIQGVGLPVGASHMRRPLRLFGRMRAFKRLFSQTGRPHRPRQAGHGQQQRSTDQTPEMSHVGHPVI